MSFQCREITGTLSVKAEMPVLVRVTLHATRTETETERCHATVAPLV